MRGLVLDKASQKTSVAVQDWRLRDALFALIGFFTLLMEGRAIAQPISTEALLRQGSYLQRSGYYLDAKISYQEALEMAEKHRDLSGQALAKSALGYVAYLLHQPVQAELLLLQASRLAVQLKRDDILTVVQYYSGLTAQGQHLIAKAQSYYQQALVLADTLKNNELVTRCHLALAQLANDTNEFVRHQERALQSISQLKQATLAGELRLELVENWLENPLLLPLSTKNSFNYQILKNIYQQMTQAFVQLPPENKQAMAKYYVLLGQVYETQRRYEEALKLTQTALNYLQGLNAEDLKIFYNWQVAKLYQALGQFDATLNSFRRAITGLEGIRQDIPILYEDGKSSFLQIFGPLCRGAITLLLQQTDKAGAGKLLQEEAKQLMERLKQTELEDFFKDRCLLTDVSSNSEYMQAAKNAILYPIILPDR